MSRTALAVAATSVVVVALATAALAVPPRGNANYVAVDSKGRPAITLWMRTRTNMMIFACYRWGAIDHGDHYNNQNPITVNANGWFAYNGPGMNLHGATVRLKLVGHFVSRDEAVGKLTAPCAKNYAFVAHYAPAPG